MASGSRKPIVNGPSLHSLMFNQYTRSNEWDNPTKALLFTFADGSTLGVIPQIYQHANRRDDSAEWLIIGQVATGGTVLMRYSTQTRKGWCEESESSVPMLTELYLDKSDVAVATFSAAKTFFGQTKVKIALQGGQFTAWFHDLVEQEPRQGALRLFTLPRRMSNREIIAQLGGRKKAIVSLAQVWALLECQPKGEEGVLSTYEWSTNFFYVKGADAVLYVVAIRWGVKGWIVSADSLDGRKWDEGHRFFSYLLSTDKKD